MDGTSLYADAAIILNRSPVISAKVLSEALNCAKSTADVLRSLYFTCGRDPEKMRESANEASRKSKTKMRANGNKS